MSDEFKVQISLNAPPPAQYAKGAMANFRGETVDEVKEQLEAARELGLLELASEVESVWLLAAKAGASYEGSEPAQTGSQDSGGPVTNLHVCTHGKRTRREGTGRKGPWVGWFCPQPKGAADQCAPQWED